MSKFHVSPNSGEVGECKAKLQCPFGGEDKHFPTKEAARQSFEEQMQGSTFLPLSKKDSTEDPEVAEARKMMIQSGDVEAYIHNSNAAEYLAHRTGMKQEKLQEAIDQFKAEDEAEAAVRAAATDKRAREIAANTDPDISKIKKGSTVAFKEGNILRTVKVSRKANGKIYGTSDSGSYVDGWTTDGILTSESNLDNEPATPKVDSVDPEVEAARRWMLDTGDADSFLYNDAAAKNLATKTGMKEEKIQAVIDEWKAEDKAALDAKYARQTAKAREVAANTDPDISKVKKGSTVAFKFGDNELVTVKVTSHRNGKIYGNTSDGSYADSWPDDSILTSESKLDD